MTRDEDLDLDLRAWFDGRAPASAPAGLLESIAQATHDVSRRPSWLAGFVSRTTGRPAIGPALSTAPLAAALLVLLAAVLAIAALAGASRTRLPDPFGPARAGLIVYDAMGTLMVAGPDGASPSVLGAGQLSGSSPSFSRDGTRIAYWTRSDRTAWDLMVTHADGTGTVKVATASFEQDFGVTYTPPVASWSPDGSEIAFSVGYGGISTLYVARSDAFGVTQLGDASLGESDPAWSPDGSLIAFRGGVYDKERGVYVMRADGDGVPRRLTTAAGIGLPAFIPSWSPDGRTIAFAAGINEDASIWTVHADGTAEQLIDRASTAVGPVWSPDGRRLAWVRRSGVVPGSTGPVPGPPEIVVQDLASGGRVELIDEELDQWNEAARWGPAWAPDGSRLLAYLRGRSGNDDRLILFDSSGRTEPVIVPAQNVSAASWQRLAP